MPAGILVTNTSGTTLIDENYSNLALRTKGSSTIVAGNLGRTTIAMSGMNSPMVAIASERFMGVKTMLSSLASFVVQGPQAGSWPFEYFVFDVPQPSGQTFGLMVYRADGSLAFDSGNKYARVVDIYGGANLTDWEPTKTYAAGRKYAVVQLKRAYRKEVENMGGGVYNITWYMSGSRVVSNQVTGDMIVYKTDTVSPGSAPPSVTDYSATFAVLDVTNY